MMDPAGSVIGYRLECAGSIWLGIYYMIQSLAQDDFKYILESKSYKLLRYQWREAFKQYTDGYP